jgi:hypothetical protein
VKPLLAPALAVVASFCASAQPIVWDRIAWHSEHGVPHAALMLDVRLDGVKAPVLMQLDTGCDVNMVFAEVYDASSELPARAGSRQVGLSGVAAGARFDRERFWIRHAAPSWLPSGLAALLILRRQEQRGQPISFGTLGAEFLEKRVLLLDLVAQRVAILSSDQPLPAALAARARFLPLDYRSHKMYLSAIVNSTARSGLIFDTGSSSVAAVTTRERWGEWTGRRPEDARNLVRTGNSWGKTGKWIGAPITGELCVGGLCRPSPVAWFEASGLPNFQFERYAPGTAGLVGCALFDGGYTVVVDVARSRFGVMAGSVAGAGVPAAVKKEKGSK